MAKSKSNCWQTLRYLVTKGIIPKLAHRILLWGPKGTGKSSWPHYEFGFDHVESCTCHKAMYPEDLLGSYQLKEGSTVWSDGPYVRACRKSHNNIAVLVLDEVDQHSPELRCCLQGGLNDKDIANVTLPNGETIKPGEGFLVVATSNQPPNVLWEPLLDRFDLVLFTSTPADGMIASLPKGLGTFLANHTAREQSEDKYVPPISPRGILRLNRLGNALDGGMEEAAELLFGKNAKTLASTLAIVEG